MKPVYCSLASLLAGLVLGQSALAQDIAYLQLTDGYWQAWTMNADGSHTQQVTFDKGDKTRVSWYPGGQHVLVNHANGVLYRVDTQQGEQAPIPVELQGMLDAVVSPDGTTIAFSLSTGDSIDNNNLWLVDAKTGKDARLLTRMPRLQHEPSWAPDGKHLYFLSGQGGQSHDIWRVRIDGGSTEQLTVNSLYHFDIAVSASGTRAFSSNRSGNYEVWVWPQNGEPRQLTHHPALDARPSWSPDGQSLVFESTRDGQQAIWRMDVANGELKQLSPDHVDARFPTWRQDAE